jgi:hypothetical protein
VCDSSCHAHPQFTATSACDGRLFVRVPASLTRLSHKLREVTECYGYQAMGSLSLCAEWSAHVTIP